MQDYSPIAGLLLTLAGQRVSMHKCGSDPPNAGHLPPMDYTLNSSYCKCVLIFWTSERSERENFWGVQGFWPMYRGKWQLCTGILLK